MPRFSLLPCVCAAQVIEAKSAAAHAHEDLDVQMAAAFDKAKMQIKRRLAEQVRAVTKSRKSGRFIASGIRILEE